MKKIFAAFMVLVMLMLVPSAEASWKDSLKKLKKKVTKSSAYKKAKKKAKGASSKVKEKTSSVTDSSGRKYLIAFDDEVVLKG